MSSAYGRIVSAPQIERGIEVTLRYMLGPYVGEVCDQLGLDRWTLPDPSDVQRLANPDQFRDGEQVAMVVIATPGTTDVRRDADGYALTWEVQAGIVCDLGDPLKTRDAAEIYAAAIGTCLTHQGCANVEPDGTTWSTDDHGRVLLLEGSHVWLTGEGYQPVPSRPDLMMGGAVVQVRVENARPLYGGPDEPPGTDGDGHRLRVPVAEPAEGAVEPSVTVEPL